MLLKFVQHRDIIKDKLDGKNFIKEIDNEIYEITMNGIKYIILEKKEIIKWDTEKKNLYDWYRCLNQILMLINNPMLSQGLGFGK